MPRTLLFSLLLPLLALSTAAHSNPPPTGPHTVRVTAPCTRFVSPRGRDRNHGRSLKRAWRSAHKAGISARAGDVVCFAPGRYRQLNVQRLLGTSAKPVVFRRSPGASGQVLFTVGTVGHGTAVSIARSSHVHLYDVTIEKARIGVAVKSSAYCRVDGVRITGMGYGGIYVGRLHSMGKKRRFLGPAAHHVDVIGNTIEDTGKVVARYGEGVYVGAGAVEGDDTHDIYVADNELRQIRAEGIELKPGTYNLVVRNNRIVDSSHIFHGAITVSAQRMFARDANFLVEGNVIGNYRSTADTVAGITIGGGNGIVRNNVIWGIEGGRGIRTTTTFANPKANRVLIEANTIWCPGGAPSTSLHDGHERTGMRDHPGQIELRNNATDDGSAGSRVLKRFVPAAKRPMRRPITKT